MTHTNEFLRGMFSAYMGCDVMDIRKNRIGKVVSINKIRVWYEHENSNVVKSIVQHFAFYAEIKPILTPLSEITNSDAVEVAKIMTVATNCDWVGAGKNETIRFLHLLIIGNKENNDYDDNVALGSGVVKQIIDYLRSKHYDVGYMHILSLIAADLAISSKQI